MKRRRVSGILLHPTSLPGPYGIGDLGQAAYDFVEFLHRSKQSLWQVLPLGPTGYGDSPYASFSSFAGNPLLISLEKLIEMGDLDQADLEDIPDFSLDKVDYGWVLHWKMPLLEKAARNFLEKGAIERKVAFEEFCLKQVNWLEDFALFMAIKEEYERKAREEEVWGAMWSNYWAKDIALRQPEAIQHWQEKKAETIAIRKVWQYFFFQQWTDLKEYANERGIQIIGDIPIFVAPDSVDVWANRDLFHLDENGQPTVVAGVPPDYFSATGQLWGNPLYNWEAMRANKFKWWLDRIQHMLELVDIIRVDHFRGFEAYWEIPAAAETAMNGKWVKAPGWELFETVGEVLGRLPILAEDLGFITPAVETLRDQFHFPGMKILQFSFDVRESGGLNANNQFLPHNYGYNSVVYTGTHDNDTTLGWYQKASSAEQDAVRRYMGRPDHDIAWEFIRLAISSVARFAIIPMQDTLSLNSDARMNEPSTASGNWTWRFRSEALNDFVSSRLADMASLYGRNQDLWD